MRRAKFVPLVICAVSAAVLVIGVSASSAGRAAKVAIPLAPAYTNAQLDAYAGANWLSNGGDLKDDRYSTLNQVTPANVSGLKQAWHIHLGECVPVNGVTTSCPGQEKNAVVADGIMYLATSKRQVFAIDATNVLLELAGTSANKRGLNLDRHWRNARTDTLHDPVRWKYHVVGNYHLNGVTPPKNGAL